MSLEKVIAIEAYEAIFADDPDAPVFDELPKHMQYAYVECVEKGGDASNFGEKVKEILSKAHTRTYTVQDGKVEDNLGGDAVTGGDLVAPEKGDPKDPTEDEMFADKACVLTEKSLSALTKPKLVALASFREVPVTEDNNKSEIIAALLKQ